MKNLKSYREYLEYVYTNEFSIGNMLPQVPLNEKSNTEKPNKVIKNDKGQIVPTARKFVSEVGKLAKKYDANYFIVTDGASGMHNNGNPAVKNARDSQVEWEKKHGFDPDEDWSDTNLNESFIDNDLVMENLTDIPNGVNPYSRTKFFHLSMDDTLDGKTLTPRIPSWIKKMMADNKEEFIKNMETVKKGGSTDKIYCYEEYKTPRVCFSSSINGCLNAILMDNMDRVNLVGKCVHVYVPEKPISQYRYRTNKDIKKSGDVFDANITNEIWILEPVKVKYYGSIIVDSGRECKFLRKSTNDKNKKISKYNYKWHWYLKERERKENNKNVNESVFMNKDDYYFDFDKFESGESNILFVTGLTGSGKSTIGRSFASKYHAEYVELDLMDPCSNLCSQSLDEIKKDKSNKVIYEYLSSHKSVYERLKSGKMRNDEIFLNNVRFISFVRSYANKHKDTKFIVEGLQLYEYCTFRKTIIKPMVIKGTSVLTSFIRKVKREKWPTKDIIKYAPGTVKRMIKDDKVLLQLINACKTDDVINESVSNITSKSAKGPDDALAKDIRAVIKSLGSDDYKSFDYKSKKMYYQSVYYDGDNPIGFVFTRSFDEEGRHSLTISVALNPDYRGKGLALKMVRDVLNTIKQDKSIYQIYWGADMDNKGSIELAKRAGFKHNYDYRDSTFYTKVVNDTKTVNESVKRSELPDDVFGIPQERKYPMQDKQHVKAAIKFFNYVEPKYEEQLANRIIENMKIYNIDASSIGDKNRLKKYIIEGSRYDMTHSLVKDLEFLYFESGDPDIPDLIEPIVKQLESKGYQVKYASPGHTNTRFDNDQNKDGVINAKMRSTARIIFSRDYRFKTTPQGWEWKVLENGSKALYVKPYTYNEKMGSKEEAFKKWQTFYIDNMKSWVTDLPKAGSDAKSKPDVNF